MIFARKGATIWSSLLEDCENSCELNPFEAREEWLGFFKLKIDLSLGFTCEFFWTSYELLTLDSGDCCLSQLSSLDWLLSTLILLMLSISILSDLDPLLLYLSISTIYEDWVLYL